MTRLLSTSPRYLAISLICFVLNTALLIGLDRVGVHYVGSVIVSGFVLTLVSYRLHIVWTFRVDGNTVTFARYALAQSVNTPIALALMFVFYDRMGLTMAIAAPAVILLMFLYNFLSSYWAIAVRSTCSET